MQNLCVCIWVSVHSFSFDYQHKCCDLVVMVVVVLEAMVMMIVLVVVVLVILVVVMVVGGVIGRSQYQQRKNLRGYWERKQHQEYLKI